MSNCQQNLHSHFASACDRFKQVHNLADLAAQIGMSADVLRNKFNPAQARHKLTATDLIDLYRVTGDDTLFDGLLFDCQLTAVRLPAAATAAPEARAQQALNAGAQILGVTAQATTLLAGDRVTKSNRNTVVSGIWAGIEHLVLLALGDIRAVYWLALGSNEVVLAKEIAEWWAECEPLHGLGETIR